MFNHYAYALGNPLRFQDPTGHRACEDDDCLNSGPVVLRYNRSTLSGVVRRYSLSADIINERFVRAVGREATRFKLPARLLAVSMYAEIRSRWFKDDIEDYAVRTAAQCRRGCSITDQPRAALGRALVNGDRSFGPAKIKPSAALNPEVTVPTLRAASVAVPPTAFDAAVQALDFDRSVQLAAAYLKGLADLRKGDTPGNTKSRSSDMLKVDMQIVRSAYNSGLKPFRDLSNDTLEYYQTSTFIDPKGVAEEASPWLDAFAEIFGP